MINFQKIINEAEKLDKKRDKVFNLETDIETKYKVFEDSNIIVNITLSRMFPKTSTKWFHTTVKFKKYNNIEKDSPSIKVNTKKPLTNSLKDTSIKSIIETLLDSCNINNIEDINFTTNGYSLEVIKTSNKYVTICEHINAVRFEQRFESLEHLFNYIYYRKKLHTTVSIDVSVSDSEYDNIKRSINVMEENSTEIYKHMMTKIIPPLAQPLSQNFSIENIERIKNNINFDVVYDDNNDISIRLSCVINNVIGLRVENNLDGILNSNDVEIVSYLLGMLTNLERRQHGNFDRYVILLEQLEKFSSKVSRVDVDDSIEQMNPYDITVKVFEALKHARRNEKMISNKVYLTPFDGYKRYIILDGVMKNRKKCSLVVIAKKKNNEFVEYTTPVEKNRITGAVNKFMSNYFI